MKKNTFKMLPFFLVLIFLFICVGSAEAHDLWLNVENHYPETERKVGIKVIFGHNFPHPDILIPEKAISEFSYVTPSGEKKLVGNIREYKQGERKGVLLGELSFYDFDSRAGTYVVAAARKRKGDKNRVPSEKYGKTIIVVGNKSTESVRYEFGHRIEIIPLANPSMIKAGGVLPVKILFEGKPLSTYVYATYAGYWSNDAPFPVLVKSDEKGMAYIKIDRPGTWLILSNHKVNFSASLTFEIK